MREAVRSTLAHKRPDLGERLHALLQKKRVTARPLLEQRLQRLDRTVGAEEGPQETLGALRRQRIEPEPRVVRLAPPGVMVLGPVGHQEQKPRGGKAIDETVEDGLRLGVDPVEILEHQEKRLDLALAEEEALDGVER